MSPAGDEAVARNGLLLHPEIAAAVRDQFVQLLERILVKQQLDALARRQLAFFVLALLACVAAALFGSRMPPPQFIEPVHL